MIHVLLQFDSVAKAPYVKTERDAKSQVDINLGYVTRTDGKRKQTKRKRKEWRKEGRKEERKCV